MKPPIRNYFVYCTLRSLEVSTHHEIKEIFRRERIPICPEGAMTSLRVLSNRGLALVMPPKEALDLKGLEKEFKPYNYWNKVFPSQFLTPTNLTYKAVDKSWEEAYVTCVLDKHYISSILTADNVPLHRDMWEWAQKDHRSLEKATWLIAQKIKDGELTLEGLILKPTKS
ncbi:hypothetical protein DRN75_04425 [Nanoarchaeota archaeon]|nr:MAG: hypothetical protein DRN75_04425 [Nanoarchaeota archaeon]